MELRALRYFVAVARNKSFTAAAAELFVTQPTLSRTIAELEEEIGHVLLDRSTRRIELTEKGLYLYRQAESILELVAKTKLQAQSDRRLAGEITIVAGETPAMRIVADAVMKFQKDHPDVVFHLISANAIDSAERLRMGLADFGVFMLPCDMAGFDSIPLPATNRWGVLTRRDGPLRGKTCVTPKELLDLPLLVPKQKAIQGRIAGWLGSPFNSLKICGTYNLLWNASLVVREGGNALCIEGIVQTDAEVMFLPLKPDLRSGIVLVWPEARAKKLLNDAFLQAVEEIIRTNNAALYERTDIYSN